MGEHLSDVPADQLEAELARRRTAPAAKPPAKPKRRFGRKRYWIIAGAVVIAIIAAASGNKNKTSTSPSVSASASGTDTPATQPVVETAADKARKAAASYITGHAADAREVQVNVSAVQAGVALGQKSTTEETLYQIAQLAQTAHDNLDGVRNNFAGVVDTGALGDAELEVFTAANDLKNSMGALVAYTGDPNPAALAHFTSQYQPAVARWDDGVRTIWQLAHRSNPPVL